MVKRLFLTPPNLPETTALRCITLPDSKEWWGILNGALLLAAQPYNYEQVNDTDLTAEEVAAYMYGVYVDYLGGNCAEECICEVPADPELGMEPGYKIRIIRRGAGGHTEELVDGEWVEPTGEYEVPPLPERTEPDRLCLAAANAANVLDEMYEEITDAIQIELSTASVFQAIYAAAISLIGLFAGVTAAAYASLGKAFLDVFVDTADVLGSDVWNGDFTDELKCVLLSFAQDDGFGHITFEWPVLRQAVTDNFINRGLEFDTDKALLWGQVGYLLDVLAADGLNIAGSTTAIDEDECEECYGPFCYKWGDINEWDGWEPIGHNGAIQDSVSYLSDNEWHEGQSHTSYPGGTVYYRELIIKREIPLTTITAIEAVYDSVKGSFSNYPPNGDNNCRLYGWREGSIIVNYPTTSGTGAGQVSRWEGSEELDEIWFAILLCDQSGSSSGTADLISVQVEGNGLNPFGEDNC